MSSGPQSVSAPTDSVRLRIHRVASGAKDEVCLLAGPPVMGFFVHYLQERSHFCAGDDCPAGMHKLPPSWKGYLPATLYVKGKGHFEPVILEVTESLELDFRDALQPGELWQLTRLPDVKKKRFPVIGRKIEETCPERQWTPFPIVDGIRWIYHDQRISLSHRSPLPARLVLPVMHGPAPGSNQRNAHPEKPPTDEQREKLARILNGFGAKGGAK